MLNSTLLMSSAHYFGNDHKLNPYYQDGATVDTAKAEVEHNGIKDALHRAGRALMATLPPSRQSEEAWARTQLTELGYQIDDLPQPWRFSGQGDALICGDLVFCGAGYRSDEEALEYAAQHFGLQRIQLQTLPQLDAAGQPVINAVSGWADSYWYDIDLTLAILREPDSTGRGLIAYCPEAFTPMADPSTPPSVGTTVFTPPL